MKQLYKYVVPERIDVLETLKIRFTQPEYMNDPFDSLIRFNKIFDEQSLPKNFKDENLVREIMDKFDKQIISLSNSKGYDLNLKKVLEHDGKTLAEFNDILSIVTNNFVPVITEHQEEILKILNTELTNQFGILSLTESPDNIAMWAHYSNVHTGLVLIFNADDEYFTTNSDINDSLRAIDKIRYSNKKIIFKSLKYITSGPMFRKHKNWEYENEWRMIRLLKVNSHLKFPNIYLFDLPPSAITGVIVGYRCDKNLVEYLYSLKNKVKHLNHLEIYKAIPNLDEYKMEIIKAD